MPANPGYPPPYELVDIVYQGGWIVRGIEPTKRRWTRNDPRFPNPNPFDIARYQPAGAHTGAGA
ncbi:hypothetical protein ABIC65_001070 [Sphingomonas trueperi]|uniref:hypothetical protein n=1 Tax=Sphingomonas trueperi TaxID=53317 RepID=UPI003398490C